MILPHITLPTDPTAWDRTRQARSLGGSLADVPVLLNAAGYIQQLQNRFPASVPLPLAGRGLNLRRAVELLGSLSTGEAHILRFLCCVWHGRAFDDEEFRPLNFDFADAAGTLDAANRKPIADWMAYPYHP